MNWNVKEDFCGEGATYSSYGPALCHICPSVKIQTDRELTADERRRVIDALVKAASVEMIHINEDTEAIAAHNRVANAVRESEGK